MLKKCEEEFNKDTHSSKVQNYVIALERYINLCSLHDKWQYDK